MLSRPRRSVLVSTLAAVFVLACSDSTNPGPELTQFGQPISVSEFQAAINSPALVEIEFATATGIVAREIEVELDEDDEKVASRVLGINATTGTVTLEMAGGSVVVSYNSSTRFRTPTNSNVTRAEWETQIVNAVSSGGHPAIEARRPLPAVPQSPTLSTFTATDLRLTTALEKTSIEMLVDADNFETVASPPPLALLRVLNTPVQITTTTRLERIVSGMPTSGTIEFEARVTAASTTTNTLTLTDGTIIQIGPATTFDAEGDLLTLAAVVTAVGSGDVVRVEGRGTVQSVGPPATIAATSVKVEVDDRT